MTKLHLECSEHHRVLIANEVDVFCMDLCFSSCRRVTVLMLKKRCVKELGTN